MNKLRSLSKMLAVFGALIFGCDSNEESAGTLQRYNGLKGSLYFSGASDLNRFDFATGDETLLFQDGRDYRVTPDAKSFVWHKSDPFEGTSQIHIHELGNPSKYQTISVDIVIDATPALSPDKQTVIALAANADDPYSRQNAIIFDLEGKLVGWLPRVKAFCFSPDGKDVIASAEVVTATSPVYALIQLKNYRSTESEAVIIREYADYGQLPISLAISPDGGTVAYAHLEHIYTIPLMAGAEQQQITTSSLHEINPTWSPDGAHLAFTHYSARHCGRIFVIPLSGQSFPIRILSGEYEKQDADFPLQLMSTDELFIVTCSDLGIVWSN